MTASSEGLPRISVVVPSYNQGRFLAEALDSIFRQDYPAAEVIVMDGGSTDQSVDVIRAYAGRLAHWQSGKDGGQSAAINAGMARATGAVVAWLNSDDFYLGDCLWAVADAYLRFPGHGLYVGNGFRCDGPSGQLTPFCRRHLALNRRALVHGLDFILQPSTFFLKEAWDRVGGLDPALRYGMDWDLIIRIARHYPAVLINEFLAASREYDDTKTRSGGLERALELCALARRHAGRELTPGSLYYLIGALFDGGAGGTAAGVHQSLATGMRRIERRWLAEFGGHDGFPSVGDPQDRLYLPRAGQVRARRPAAGAGNGLPAISVVCAPGASPESVLAQDYPNAEALVATADPGQLSRGPGPVHCWRARARHSPAAVINEGLARARGEVLGWLRDGEELGDGALREVGAAFAADPDLDLACANALCLDDVDGPHVVGRGGGSSAFCYGQAAPPALLPQCWAVTHALRQPAIFFRRRLLARAGELDTSYRHLFDLELWWRFARVAKARKIQRTLVLCHPPETGWPREERGRRAEWGRLRRSRWLGSHVFTRDWPRVLGGWVWDYVRDRFGPPGRRAAG
jgi:glycosyltransferase involved in cell wall biosynthesis